MKILLCIMTAILSIFTLVVPPVPVCKPGYSVPVSIASVSTPKSNSINFSGSTAYGNPFMNTTSAYFTASNNWGYVQDLVSNNYYTLGGVSFDNATPYASTRPVLVMNFSEPMPNAFEYYLYVHDYVYSAAFGSSPTYTIYSYFFEGNTSTRYSNSSFFGEVGVQIFNGMVYHIMQFTLPATLESVTKFEIRGAYAGTDSYALVPFIQLDYFVQPADSSYSDGYLEGYNTANNTVTESSASYQAGVEQGTTDGYNSGYSAGVEQGTTTANNTVTESSASYRAGYNAGQNSGDTFYKMVVSVLDAPVQVFLDTFNFEVFGVNVSSIILSLFTLALITFIIKLLI